ncbi:MAG TPA: glucosidase [Labilithrix sp.]|nr:glucosidase [Labilithrix sp.]
MSTKHREAAPRVMTSEHRRLIDARNGAKWRRWGTYLSERQWGTVREDYSANGDAWNYLTHDQARFRAYRWGEDGLLGYCDNRGLFHFSLALWNGQDPWLKERLFGLSGPEGNHGETVCELYWYLDATPTGSYARAVYKYPQRAFPYEELRALARSRSRAEPSPRILDTNAFEDDRYFDVEVEYAKASPEDILIRIVATNRGRERAMLDLLPTFWFRNTWAWHTDDRATRRPELRVVEGGGEGAPSIEGTEPFHGNIQIWLDRPKEIVFTENETNNQVLFNVPNRVASVKDAFHAHVVGGERSATSLRAGTKAAGRWTFHLDPGASCVLRLRMRIGASSKTSANPLLEVDDIFALRRRECDEFYAAITPPSLSDEEKNVYRQALSSTLWTKQYYNFDLERWLSGDSAPPQPPVERRRGRNKDWRHLYNSEVISMPDKWEYPWYAAWDLAFHALPLALVDPDFAKEQLVLLTREWYMHPNGQLPAYEWAFSDVNPPVHAWAALRVYQIDRRLTGRADRDFLESIFHKLMLNFTWWVNRKDASGKNVFEGGFLGLDNIGVFDRSNALPRGGQLEQADATSWMGMYCLNLLAIALELAVHSPSYQDVANKFFEHFLLISSAMTATGDGFHMWDDEDGFFYDVLRLPGREPAVMRVRSMVGLIPLFAVETIDESVLERFPAFVKRAKWFASNRPELARSMDVFRADSGEERHLLSILDRDRLARVLSRVLDEEEFLAPHGVRALSRIHAKKPYEVELDGVRHRVDYEPGESSTGLFGGNSNWRGPIWFPVNYLMIEALQRYHHYYGDSFRIECPTGSGRYMNLWEVASELSRRLVSLFLRDMRGRRPADDHERMWSDPSFRDLITFYEYFHGEDGHGLGAMHQTGWTALVAKLIEQSPKWPSQR